MRKVKPINIQKTGDKFFMKLSQKCGFRMIYSYSIVCAIAK